LTNIEIHNFYNLSYQMETLFALLLQFVLHPTIENVEYTKKEKTTISYLIQKSGYLKECSITGVVGQKKGVLVLWMICKQECGVYNAKMGIDYNNKLYIRYK